MKVLIGDTIFIFPTGDKTTLPFHAVIWATQGSSHLKGKGSTFSSQFSVESRIIHWEPGAQERGRKNDKEKKREEISPRFPRLRFLKHAPVATIWTPRPRSSFFARDRTETLATQAKKTG